MLNYLRKIISQDNPIRLFWHKLKGIIAAVKNGFPANKMIIIGVTGTNGKTTTVHIIEHLLRLAGKKVAMISTVEYRINGTIEPNLSKKTTLSPFLTQKFLKRCLKNKIEYVVIEASSHALQQSRLFGIHFSIAALTNITHEHLDYHGTMEKYRDAKIILFKNVNKTCLFQLATSKMLDAIPHKKTIVLNQADQFFENFKCIKCPHKIIYGFENGNLEASNIAYTKLSSKFTLSYKENKIETKLKMPGFFNIENAMAATGAALACQLNLEQIKNGFETFQGVPGRMERITSPRGFEVIVDFALTPDALEKLYKTLHETALARIIGIIGSCGNRDKEKRPIMGKIVAEHSDITIVTDEEPYSEDPKIIMQAVLKGAKTVKQLGKGLHLIEDRYEAIKFAVQKAQKGDIIVITGMGNYATRTMNDGSIEWDERKVVREIIEKQA